MKVIERKLNNEKTKKDYKKVVWIYNFWSWVTESKAAKYVIEFSDIKNNQTILEVACGTGVVFEQIVLLNPNGTNYGVDLSPDMLKKAKKRLKKLNKENFKLEEGNTLNLKFDNNSIDRLINNYMVDLMPYDTFDKIAEEFYRVTKPNGIVVISTFSFGRKKVNKFWLWLSEKIPDLLAGCRPVSFNKNLINAGFVIEKDIEISQNTFPSRIIKARKQIQEPK